MTSHFRDLVSRICSTWNIVIGNQEVKMSNVDKLVKFCKAVQKDWYVEIDPTYVRYDKEDYSDDAEFVSAVKIRANGCCFMVCKADTPNDSVEGLAAKILQQFKDALKGL